MSTELFHWTSELDVGIQEHHGSATSRQVLDKLADYTRTHFAVEESLMRVSNYPDFAAHKQNHEDLIAQVQALQEKLDSGQGAITFELLHFLKVWLTRHINEADKRFGAHFLAHGGASQWSEHVEEAMKKRKWWWKFW